MTGTHCMICMFFFPHSCVLVLLSNVQAEQCCLPALWSSFPLLPLSFYFSLSALFFSSHDLLSQRAPFIAFSHWLCLPSFPLLPSLPCLHLPCILRKFSMLSVLKKFPLFIHTLPPLQSRGSVTLMRMVL